MDLTTKRNTTRFHLSYNVLLYHVTLIFFVKPMYMAHLQWNFINTSLYVLPRIGTLLVPLFICSISRFLHDPTSKVLFLPILLESLSYQVLLVYLKNLCFFLFYISLFLLQKNTTIVNLVVINPSFEFLEFLSTWFMTIDARFNFAFFIILPCILYHVFLNFFIISIYVPPLLMDPSNTFHGVPLSNKLTCTSNSLFLEVQWMQLSPGALIAPLLFSFPPLSF